MTPPFGRWFGKRRDGAPARDVVSLAAPLAAPAIHAVKVDSASRSHFGGDPQLPAGVAWPERSGAKLAFLARLSLAELQRAHPIDWLPGAGALLFFYDVDQQPWGFDPKDRGGSAVLLVPDLPQPTPQRDAEPDGGASPFRHRNISFRRIDALPTWERDSIRALALTKTEADALLEHAEGVFQSRPKHQIAGFPAPVQGDVMELECQLVTHGLYCGDATGYQDPRAKALEPGAANWRLLFQLDTDDELDAMWGDCGMLYFWVEEEAARQGRFENTWLILQCG